MMEKYCTVAAVMAFALILTKILCDAAENVDMNNFRQFCTCPKPSSDIKELQCTCNDNQLEKIPRNLPSFLQQLTIIDAAIENLDKNSFSMYKQSLTDIILMKCKNLKTIEDGVFDDMPHLRAIYISHAPNLRMISPSVFNVTLPNLKIVRIVQSGLEECPNLGSLKTNKPLHMVDLENNHIQRVVRGKMPVSAEILLLNYNSITEVEPSSFDGSQIAKISLRGNLQLQKLDANAFMGIKSLRTLDLSETSIRQLPTSGLEELDVLKIEHTHTMEVFPSIYNFKNIQEAWLTYPYHCCAFHFPETHSPKEYADHEVFVKNMLQQCQTMTSLSAQAILKPSETTESESFFSEDDETFHSNDVTVGTQFEAVCGNVSKNYRAVRCFPEPDAFNPCEDLMGNWTLRIAVWVVAVAALLGNIAVLFVLLSSRFRLTVPKFLMCNLAIADFCMGLYLLLIAIMDARSIGHYFNHAIFWQRGIGCQVAGFLTVFSCMLSVFTLTIITGERWYTITYAIHLNRRLKLGASMKIMAVGWLFSILMGALPLLGTSGYSKTSICLPMENSTSTDKLYLFSLLMFNGIAFVVICACYAKMYISIRGGREAVASVARSDMTVAKRMALLVFTDFACWAPVAFFGLTALAGYPLIDVPKTKILLVFFYPLNSCANPYLYALLTQQYRRDLFALLARLGVCNERVNEYKGGPGGAGGGRNGKAISGGFRKTYHDTRYDRRVTGDQALNSSNHRGSLMTTVTSVDSVVASTRPGSLTPLQENTSINKLQLELLPLQPVVNT
ncbi:lutropin-choriogonadotropic hormone receptor-like [Daktulosphaira vitifoliae]|uniref:lutropin-choriogonadotropic hormone receptor-like n=1 Tax=Daktulosphaira vitifoliae TaxID=58002 RepID=UPI0021AAB155|nr:lutropin-choriogonadotropic hormone receptor-like [Daktulosphaira vitifoliae]XP_050544069.1 lutropin-choriogonadotropic hormone receptor-like [Daktulosphaira vitifoliae]XP_050544070.1 lutropin-choriogonadotropic hormone receptor-like [Daktulosphaira vitifoliae]XP_050544071.1 lutropin-choriogonadotropic hormone receptor-like [Daktulosphaira vitifoliae]